MTKTEKIQLVSELTSAFTDTAAIIVCDYRGMTVHQLESIRLQAQECGSKVKVVKNTLASIALKNAGQNAVDFVDTNIVIWGNDQIATCKIAEKAASSFSEKFVIKTGLLEGKVVDKNTIIAMAKLPSREELLGMLLNVWQGPARGITIGLDRLAAKLSEAA
jgi:large subunit ribosomal protein L10